MCLQALTNEERLNLAQSLEVSVRDQQSRAKPNSDEEPFFKSFAQARIHILKDTKSFPFLVSLSL